MARVHSYSSTNDKRARLSPENIAEEPPVPTLLEEHENKTISVQLEDHPTLDIDTSSPSLSTKFLSSPPPSSERQDSLTTQLTTSNAALTAALLQNTNNDMVGAVAAAFSVKPETLNILKENEGDSTTKDPLPSVEDGHGKSEDAWDQARVAATALQLLGLSHPEHKDKDKQTQLSDSSLINNRTNLYKDADLTSEDMIQDYKRGTWTREEDELLLAGIKKYGYGRWKEIATSIPGRKGKQLKQRWDNTLAAKYVDQEWIKSKIRNEEALQHQSSEDKTLKFLETTDWNDIALKITEKAREGDQHAIEALLSQALLGTVASTSTTAPPSTDDHLPSSTSSQHITTNESTPSSPIHNTTIHHPHDSTPGTPIATEHSDIGLNFSRSPLDNAATLNYADAAALALYSHLSQQNNNNTNATNTTSTTTTNTAAAAAAAAAATTTTTSSNTTTGPTSSNLIPNHSYFLTNPFGSNSNDTVAAAAAAAVAAVAQQNNNNQSNYARSPTRTSVGHKRRRSDPALAETQSAAMSIYASSTPITTTINNQTQTVYPCLFPNCGKTFARLYNLKSHSRTHTDDRPFVCQACNAAFSRNHDLKRHSKIHGGAKPYKCEGCKKSFSRLDALKRHKSNQRNKQSCTQD